MVLILLLLSYFSSCCSPNPPPALSVLKSPVFIRACSFKRALGKSLVFCPTFCDFSRFFVIFVILDGVCYDQIKKINDKTSNKNTSMIEGTTKRYKHSFFFSESANLARFSPFFALKMPVFARFLGEIHPLEEFSTLCFCSCSCYLKSYYYSSYSFPLSPSTTR